MPALGKVTTAASQGSQTSMASGQPATIADLYRSVRDLSVALSEPLSDADATAQSMEDASPAKWHLAHTSWFFETFLLRDHLGGYACFDADFHYLFNSYYEAEGDRHMRARRGVITRPSLDEILAYRAHVDRHMAKLLDDADNALHDLVILGCNHEQQHQELLLTDILHLFSQNPTHPAIWPAVKRAGTGPAPDLQWVEGKSGQLPIGHAGEGFAFDCEGPRHDALLVPHALASRPATNGEWIEFISDGGYRDASLWLSDGWAWVNDQDIHAPLYWQCDEAGQWLRFGLDGLQPVNPQAPVAHISLFEADAFASWAARRWPGARLPTEAEWESAAETLDPHAGNQLDSASAAQPRPADDAPPTQMFPAQMFGDVWEWTGSAYRPYPGFKPCEGAIGEYNGKFMSGQFVLKGASCATPRGHARASYRNFFYPHQRWQFTGVRLARDL